MSERTVAELLDAYMDQENMHNMEGRRGVENLCKIARALGYKDPMYWGQLTSTAAIGDLVMMLEDNSGMIEAMVEWIGRGGEEFRASLSAVVETELVSEHYKDCPDCGEEVNPEAKIGDACDNCGHVFNPPAAVDDSDPAWNDSDGQGA